MEKGGNASWEQVHRILFPEGPVPASLVNPDNGGVINPGAGILGPGPVAFSIQHQKPLPGFTGSVQGISGSVVIPAVQAVVASRIGKENGGSVLRKDDNPHFAAPPPVPRDPKMVHYIKLFAAFVAKFGIENENVVRAKQRGRAEFAFLFGGHPGSEASVGHVFYEWQKDVVVKVLEARKGVSEGKIPPDRLKSMQRELEQCNGVKKLKDLRIESILGLENGKLDWQKIAWELGVTLPGDKRSSPQVESPVVFIAKTNVDRHQTKIDRSRGGDQKHANDELSPNGRSKGRSRSPDRGRHRYRSRSPQRRNNSSRRSRSPRGHGRSYSRSPPPRPPRRTKREVEERNNPDPCLPTPFETHHHLQQQQQQQRHVLPPPPPPPHPPPQAMIQQQQQQQQQDHGGGAGGFVAENGYGRFMPVVETMPQGSMSQNSGLLAPFGVPFAASLCEIPVQQQQFLLQQLQLSLPPTAALPPASSLPATNTWPISEAHQQQQTHSFNQPQIIQQQQQQQQQQAVVKSVASPSNDVEMEVEDGSPKVVSSKAEANGGVEEAKKTTMKKSSKSKKISDKEKEEEEEKDNSRALKFVRNKVADFVKELLNPKWRDGILSKDDFKVIAQKAVTKVVGNLQGSQIPKGPERVDRFMTASKEKITKLVQEYVEKHTKNAPVPATSSAPITEVLA